VRAGREDLGQHGRLEAGFGQLDGGTQAGAAGADDDRVEFANEAEDQRQRQADRQHGNCRCVGLLLFDADMDVDQQDADAHAEVVEEGPQQAEQDQLDQDVAGHRGKQRRTLLVESRESWNSQIRSGSIRNSPAPLTRCNIDA
jgi:hypothetical protein